MSFTKRLRSRLQRWAIPNPTSYIIAGQALFYLLGQMGNDQVGRFDLTKILLLPDKILAGEVWRLVTFAFVPPNASLIWAVFGWIIFYFFGTTLENYWGTARYNAFLLIGILANIAAAFVAWSLGAFAIADNAFLYGTVFLAFARLFPNFVINLFFILPIQIKWLALLAWIGYGYAFAVSDWMGRLLIVASIFNYLVFFGREHVREFKQGQRKRAFVTKIEKTAKSLHTCRVCGVNSETSPKTSFRYCSKCSGQCCYCPEHIQNHEHVQDTEPAAS